ncbi:MAG TPA: ABC transporter permease [Bryobacteraceae bacterium]|nr:ABC transporter permease [Bryobacteraceae bacterium]
MRFVWISTLKDLRRIRRDPVTLLVWLGIPIFVAAILTVIFGPNEARPHGTLLVVDDDGSFGATVVTGAFSQGPLGKMITVEKVDRDEGRRRIDKGDASALLIIPQGFSRALAETKPAKLELVRNPSHRILPDMIEETLSMLADGAFYLQNVAGDELRTVSIVKAPTDADIALMAVRFNQVFIGLRKYLYPPLIQVNTQVIQDKTQRPGGFAVMLLPGILFMGIFFITRALSADIWTERTSGTLRRVVGTPGTLGAFLAGKLLASAAVLAAIGAFALLAGHLLLGLDISHFSMAVLWIAASGAAMYLFLLILQTLASTERMANLLTNFVMLPLIMLGGGFVPFDWMPQGLAQIGRLTPNGWSVVQLQSIVAGVVNPSAFVIVAAFAAVAGAAAIWRVRRTAC